MSVTEGFDNFNCDCGFSWRRGQSGAHSCGDGLRKQIAELKAQRDALAAENAAQKEYLKECSVVQGEGNWNSAAEKSVYVPAIDWMPPTPATDAYLNSVRADVLNQLHSAQKEWALHAWQYDNFDALKRAAVRHGDSELSGVIFMLDRIEGFAAQLRAGKPS